VEISISSELISSTTSIEKNDLWLRWISSSGIGLGEAMQARPNWMDLWDTGTFKGWMKDELL